MAMLKKYCYSGAKGTCGGIIMPAGSRRAGAPKQGKVRVHFACGLNVDRYNGEARLGQGLLGDADSTDRLAAHGRPLVNPAAAQHAAEASTLICAAGVAPTGTVLEPITEEHLTVETDAEINAVQEMLCKRLVIAHDEKDGLMFFLLPENVAAGTAKRVARKLEDEPHPTEGYEPDEWGGMVLTGPGLQATPDVMETIARLKEIHLRNGARAQPLQPPATSHQPPATSRVRHASLRARCTSQTLQPPAPTASAAPAAPAAPYAPTAPAAQSPRSAPSLTLTPTLFLTLDSRPRRRPVVPHGYPARPRRQARRPAGQDQGREGEAAPRGARGGAPRASRVRCAAPAHAPPLGLVRSLRPLHTSATLQSLRALLRARCASSPSARCSHSPCP